MANPKSILEKAVFVDMKTPEKKMNKSDMQCDPYEGDPYPWGLRIDLNKDSLEALGLDASDFEAGGSVMLKAKCDVTSVRIEKGKKHSSQSIDLQITSLAICDKE